MYSYRFIILSCHAMERKVCLVSEQFNSEVSKPSREALYAIGVPCQALEHGGRDRAPLSRPPCSKAWRGKARGAMAPPIIWLGAIMYKLAPQYFALEFKILTLGLMQREENMFRIPLCWMCVHCKIHYTY